MFTASVGGYSDGHVRSAMKPRRARTATDGAEAAVPTTPSAWLREIAAAYADAHEAIPLGPLAGQAFAEGELFHLAPSVCLKFRGIRSSKSVLKRATDAALASYVVMAGREPELFSSPPVAFAFCYLAAHWGLDLVTEEQATTTLDYVASHGRQLVKRTNALVGGR